MKKFTTVRLIGIILAIAVILPYLVNYAFSIPYYSDIETAVKNNSRSKSHIKIATIAGQEGRIYIALCDNNAVGAYNFHTKFVNGDVLYKVANEVTIPYEENSMAKMNTAPGSTEQIAFGIGETLSKTCGKKTGLNAEFIHFGNDENQYTIWHIISVDGLDELPALQINDMVWSNMVWESGLSADHYIALAVLLVLIALLIVVIYLKKRNRRMKELSNTKHMS